MEISAHHSQQSVSLPPSSADRLLHLTQPLIPTISTSYPPFLPPPDFFDLELEAEKLKDMFKATNSLKNPLFDETGLVKLPVDSRGVLILDAESKTRMVDVEVELDCLYEYLGWIGSAKKEVEDGEDKEWLERLRKEVDSDMGEVFDEWHRVVDEERWKRKLTDRWTHWAHFKGQDRKGEGKDGKWVAKKVVDKNKREKTGKYAEPIALKGATKDQGISEQHIMSLKLSEETEVTPSCMAKIDEDQQEATVAVVVGDGAGFKLAAVSSVNSNAHRMLSGHADTAPALPSLPEGDSFVLPPLQLVDFWW